jgi:PTS system mannose-specific IIB component
MRELVLVRIDDRLIHGQVVVKWLRHLDCDEVVIVDDEVWKDDELKTVLRLATPRGVSLTVVPGGQAVRVVHDPNACAHCREPSNSAGSRAGGESAAGGRRVLMLVKRPRTALDLLEDGLEFRELNVGGVAAREGATRVYRSISVTPAQLEILQQISARGVRVYFQTVPEERALELSELAPVSQGAR